MEMLCSICQLGPHLQFFKKYLLNLRESTWGWKQQWNFSFSLFQEKSRSFIIHQIGHKRLSELPKGPTRFRQRIVSFKVYWYVYMHCYVATYHLSLVVDHKNIQTKNAWHNSGDCGFYTFMVTFVMDISTEYFILENSCNKFRGSPCRWSLKYIRYCL